MVVAHDDPFPIKVRSGTPRMCSSGVKASDGMCLGGVGRDVKRHIRTQPRQRGPELIKDRTSDRVLAVVVAVVVVVVLAVVVVVLVVVVSFFEEEVGEVDHSNPILKEGSFECIRMDSFLHRINRNMGFWNLDRAGGSLCELLVELMSY